MFKFDYFQHVDTRIYLYNINVKNLPNSLNWIMLVETTHLSKVE